MNVTNNSKNFSFTDISNHPLATHITQAASLSLLNGYPDKTFRPDNAVTRAEFVAMTNRCLGISGCATVPFTDVPEDAWYHIEVEKALSIGYIHGTSNTTFSPNDYITRGQVATILCRIVGGKYTFCGYHDAENVPAWMKDGLCYAWTSGVFSSICQTDNLFSIDKIMTRGECAAVITAFYKSLNRFPIFLTLCEKSDKEISFDSPFYIYFTISGKNLFSHLLKKCQEDVAFSELSESVRVDLCVSNDLTVTDKEVFEADENYVYIRLTLRQVSKGDASLVISIKPTDTNTYNVSDSHQALNFKF